MIGFKQGTSLCLWNNIYIDTQETDEQIKILHSLWLSPIPSDTIFFSSFSYLSQLGTNFSLFFLVNMATEYFILPEMRWHGTDDQFAHKSVLPTQSSSWMYWFLGLLEEIIIYDGRILELYLVWLCLGPIYIPNVAPACLCTCLCTSLSDSDINVSISCNQEYKNSICISIP